MRRACSFTARRCSNRSNCQMPSRTITATAAITSSVAKTQRGVSRQAPIQAAFVPQRIAPSCRPYGLRALRSLARLDREDQKAIQSNHHPDWASQSSRRLARASLRSNAAAPVMPITWSSWKEQA